MPPPLALAALLCLAAAPPPATLVAGVQATYRRGGNLSAAFTQSYTDQMRGKTRVESGQLWVRADGRVRWAYQKPERKDFVFDGRTAYFYEPEHAQVTVFEHFAASPVAHALQFLAGQGDLLEDFTVADCRADCPPPGGSRALELTPKRPIATVHALRLLVDPAGPWVVGSQVVDPLGNRTEYAFSAVRLGAPAADGLFVFKIPEGVSVLHATGEGSAAPPVPKRPPTPPRQSRAAPR